MSEPRAHTSRFTLIRHLAGELPEREAREVTAHAASCADCRGVLAELEATQTSGAAMLPPLELPARPRFALAARPRAMAGAGLALAASIIAAVVVGPRRSSSEGALREKGADLRVGAHCLAPGEGAPHPCRPGDRVVPGTAIMVTVDLAAPRYLLLVGRGPNEEPVVFFPEAGAEAKEVPAGARPLMAHSLVVDAAPGNETFVLHASPRPFTAEEVAHGGRSDIESVELDFRK